MKIEGQGAEREEVRKKLTELAKQHASTFVIFPVAAARAAGVARSRSNTASPRTPGTLGRDGVGCHVGRRMP